MNTFLLLALLACMVGIVIMCIYLIDSIRTIEKRAMMANPVRRDERFGTLEGEKLWEVMTGVSHAGTSGLPIETLRSLFEPIVQRHMEEVFNEGMLDSKLGVRMMPHPTRPIKTSEGQVMSWLPPEPLGIIYALGIKRSSDPNANLTDLATELDAAAEKIYTLLSMRPFPLSKSLLPAPAPAPEALVDNTANPDATQLAEIAPPNQHNQGQA